MIVNDEETEAPVLVDPGQLVGGGRVLGLGDNLERKMVKRNKTMTK